MKPRDWRLVLELAIAGLIIAALALTAILAAEGTWRVAEWFSEGPRW